MSSYSPVQCVLCDLPQAQCIHGLERRKAKAKTAAAKKAKRVKQADKSKKAAQDARKGQSASSGASSGAASRPCSRCRRSPRYGRYDVCLACARRIGFVLCGKCGRYFRPEATAGGKKATCKSCKRSGGRIWVRVVTSGGLPGLGKRA